MVWPVIKSVDCFVVKRCYRFALNFDDQSRHYATCLVSNFNFTIYASVMLRRWAPDESHSRNSQANDGNPLIAEQLLVSEFFV